MRLNTLTIVGVGLIGGSIGLAAKQRGVAQRIIGVGWRRSTLNLAQDLGIIDAAYVDLAPAVADTDLAVFCTPVHLIPQQVCEAARLCRPDTILTDAGSTKRQIVERVESDIQPPVRFVGSHPLAGSEKRGPEHADANLFQDRLTVVTPTDKTDPEATRQVDAFWRSLGSRVKRMTPAEHDHALAMASHLPHLVASALAASLPPELFEVAVTGFRDTTRIASGDPGLWTGIFLQNRRAVLEALDRFSDHLNRFRSALESGSDAELTRLLHEGKKIRDALGNEPLGS